MRVALDKLKKVKYIYRPKNMHFGQKYIGQIVDFQRKFWFQGLKVCKFKENIQLMFATERLSLQ